MPEKDPLLSPLGFEKEVVRYRFRNQFAAVFFAVAIIGLATYVSREFVLTNEHERLPPAQFLGVGTVIAPRAAVLEQPLPTAARRGELPRGAAVFILADRPLEWRRVRTQIMTVDGERKIIEGWVRRADLRSPSDIREPPAGAARLGDAPVKVANVRWDADEEGRYEITGSVAYLGDRPLRAVKLIITFYDEKSNAADQRFTYVGTEATLKKNVPVPFTYVGISEKPFKSVTCRAECRYREE